MTSYELKTWRESLELTQRDAAKAHDVALPTYQSWESGKNWQTGKDVRIKASVLAMCEKITREKKS